MTPTHLSMSHEGKEILRQIVEGLEGVTAGTWVVRETTVNGRGYGAHWLEVADDDNMICISGSGGARSYTMRVIDTQMHDDNEPNLRHLARCSPDAMRAIAAYVAAVEKERDELRAALEPFANAIFNDNGDITVDLSFAKADDFIKAYFVHRRTGVALKGDAK